MVGGAGRAWEPLGVRAGTSPARSLSSRLMALATAARLPSWRASPLRDREAGVGMEVGWLGQGGEAKAGKPRRGSQGVVKRDVAGGGRPAGVGSGADVVGQDD